MTGNTLACDPNTYLYILLLGYYYRYHIIITNRFDAGLLDTITSTEDSQDCPGVCVHALATLMCYDVLENVKCPSSTMRCCVDKLPSSTNGTTAVAAATKVDQTTPAIASSVRPQVSPYIYAVYVSRSVCTTFFFLLVRSPAAIITNSRGRPLPTRRPRTIRVRR